MDEQKNYLMDDIRKMLERIREIEKDAQVLNEDKSFMEDLLKGIVKKANQEKVKRIIELMAYRH